MIILIQHASCVCTRVFVYACASGLVHIMDIFKALQAYDLIMYAPPFIDPTSFCPYLVQASSKLHKLGTIL